MSLVNDALKRAQAQKKSPPAASGPQFRPAEPAPTQKPGMGIWIVLSIAVAAIATLLLVWQNRQKTEARQPAAQPQPAAAVVAISEAKPPAQAVAATPSAPVAQVAVKPAPAPAPVVSAPAPVLKLQAIFFAPGHSSAIISGKTVHAGDNFKGFRVAAITQTSATLISATQTNVMTLEEQ